MITIKIIIIYILKTKKNLCFISIGVLFYNSKTFKYFWRKIIESRVTFNQRLKIQAKASKRKWRIKNCTKF